MNMLKMCLNPKVIAGVAIAGVAIWLVAPELIAAALPLLFLAICPLSMVLMMKAMSGGSGNASQVGSTEPRDDSAAPARATAPGTRSGT